MFQLRPATHDDVTALRAVYRAASLANPGDRAALLAHPDALVWDGGVLGRSTVVVAVEGTRVVGFATAHAEGTTWELDDLFVDPADQRKGAASLLVEELVGRARAAGARSMEVTANPHAAAFYAHAGSQENGTVSTPFGPAARLRMPLGADPVMPGPQPR